MSAQTRTITHADLLAADEYKARRAELRRQIMALKTPRRLAIGPLAMLYFENYATMLHQVQEMLHIEKGGEEQLADELKAYNPLIPQGQELVATLMLEIDSPTQRQHWLYRLAGIEETGFIRIGKAKLMAIPEDDLERTSSDGKTSSVHFLRFPFDAATIATFRSGEDDVEIGFNHDNYAHITRINAAARASLAADFI